MSERWSAATTEQTRVRSNRPGRHRAIKHPSDTSVEPVGVVTPLRGRHRASAQTAAPAEIEQPAQDLTAPVTGRHRSSAPIQPPVLSLVPPLCNTGYPNAE